MEELSVWCQKLPWSRLWIITPPCNSYNTAKIQVYMKKATQQCFNIESLNNLEIAQRYQENVQKELKSIAQNFKDINITLVAFNKSILSASSNILEQRRNRRKPWISDEVLRLSDARKGLKFKNMKAKNSSSNTTP